MAKGNDQIVREALQWIDMLWSIALFSFFYYQKTVKKRCKFEVLYVAGVGSVTDAVKLFGTTYVPATFTIKNNDIVFPWSQYCGWLITCPVLLIHLSNLAGKEVFNVRRMMKVLVAYQILMCSGATASMMDNGYRWIFYLNGVTFLTIIYRYAYEIFRESIATMPARAVPYIYRIAAIFYVSWTGFGFFWFLSPSGANLVSKEASKAAYAFFDIISKNLYSMHGWYLRWYILRKADKPTEFVQQENVAEGEDTKELRILLVEQDEVFGYFFYNMLVQHSVQVEMAKDCAEVMTKTTTGGVQFDMIMINHDLARQNNYQIMFEIRKSLFMLPVIAYGRNIPKDELDNRNATGIDDFLVAPFPDDEVQNKMKRWSRRASVNPSIITNMSNIAAMANSASSGPSPTGKPAGVPMSFTSGRAPGGPPPSMMGGGGSKGFQTVHEEPEPKEDKNAELNNKLDLLMQQLVEVKTSTFQATSEVQKRLEKQEQMYQQQQMAPPPQPMPPQMHHQMPPQQQMHMPPPQQMHQQQMMPQQMHMGPPQGGAAPVYKPDGGFDYI